MKNTRILVVGGNAAGPAAAAKAKRVNPSAEVIVFEAGEFISTGTCEIPYVLSGDIKDYEDIIFFTPERFREEKGADVFINHPVEEINTAGKFVIVNDLKQNVKLRFDYDKLVLATGSMPKKILQLPPTLANVFNLTKVSDLIFTKEYLKKNKVKSIGIIGSGYIGIETADALNNLGYDVTIIEKESLPLPYAEPEMQYLVREQIENKNITYQCGFEKFKVIYDEDKVTALNLDGRILEFDLVIVSIGFSPNVSLAVQAKIKLGERGAVKTDRKLKTSDPDVFAAGDCAEVINAVTNKNDYMPFANIAHQYGHIAGENAAGGNETVEPVIKNAAIKVFDKYLVTVGITSKEAKKGNLLFDSVYEQGYNLIHVMPGSEKTYGKIVYDKRDKRILGASFFGGRETSGYGDLVSSLIKLKQPADVLASINYNYTPPLSPFINLLSVLGRKVE